ncbi:MAG: alpha/beta fold hydrolase [Peptococcaceae bacterium]|nr:alpha/beta fold hydrolase [Peptococcaceae bacterium]
MGGIDAKLSAFTDCSEPWAVEVNILSGGVALAGTMLIPGGGGRFPCVVLAGGTMSHTRDGELVEPGREIPRRDALKRLAVRLAAAGCASIRWDKRGYGGTPPGPRPTTNEDETADLIAVMNFARQHPRVSCVVVAGESAGAYFACLAAKQGVFADAYAFLGALCSPVENLYEYNYGRLREYAGKSEENLRWAERTAPLGLALGDHYRAMIRAAERGGESYTLTYGPLRWEVPLARLRRELVDRPGDLFRHIRAPALVLHGDQDMNVPPEDAARAERIMREAGNRDVTRIMVANADHSFQTAAPDPETRMRQRHSFESFARPYSEDLYTALVAWLKRIGPSPAPGTDAGTPPAGPPDSGTAAWEGVQAIEDITDAEKNPGVDTLEGRIGPLLRGDGCRAHYIEMPPGLYCAEHPHPTESLIYTVRGRWVLASGGRRRLMRPGSLFWFGAGVATGYEVPFGDSAFILIFKGEPGEDGEAFIRYLRGLAARLKEEHAGGRPFLLAELAPEHPARLFARLIGGTDGKHPEKGV